MPWIVNIETLNVKEVPSDAVLVSDEDDFETELDAVSYVLSTAKYREDESYNDYIKHAKIAAEAAMRMKDLTC